MTRSEASILIAKLIIQINLDRLSGEHNFSPAIDYAKRSPEEQRRLYDAGASKCDGRVKVSRHQVGLAFDVLLFAPDGTLVAHWPVDISKKYHALWSLWGGGKVIEWDVGHFEV